MPNDKITELESLDEDITKYIPTDPEWIQNIVDCYVQAAEVLYQHDDHIGKVRNGKQYIASFSTYGNRTVHLYASQGDSDVEELIE